MLHEYPGSLVDSNNNWYERYLNTDQVDTEAVNTLNDKDIKLNKSTLDYRFTTVYYIALEVLNRYFGQVLQ